MSNRKSTGPRTTTKAAETPVLVVTKEETAIAAPDTTSKELTTFDFSAAQNEAGEGLGLDSLSVRLIKMPRLVLIQPGTKGVQDKTSPLFGKAGFFWNPITNECYEKLEGVAITISEEYAERQPKQGGGSTFVAKHLPGSEFVRKAFARTEEARKRGLDKLNEEGKKKYGFGKLVAPSGENVVVETQTMLGAFRDPATGNGFGALFGFKSAGIPTVAAWTSAIRMNRSLPNDTTVDHPKRIPLCANQFRLTAEYREVPNPHFAPVLAPLNNNIRDSIAQGELYDQALAAHAMFKDGRVEIDESCAEAAESGEGGAESMVF